MRQFNDAFELALLDPSAEFRFTIELSFDAAGTDLVYLTSHADAGTPVGAEVVKCISKISGVSDSLNFRYGIVECGNFSVTLADLASGVTGLLYDRIQTSITPFRKRMTFYAGFKGLDFVDYEPIITQYVDHLEQTGPGYIIKCTDLFKDLKKNIHVPDQTTLTADITASQTYIPVSLSIPTTSFPTFEHHANYTYNGGETVRYFKIDDEIIASTGDIFNHATAGPSFTASERGALGTQAAGHKVGTGSSENRKKVTEIVYLDETPVDTIHLAMCGETVDGLRTCQSDWHAGISTDEIDSAGTFTAINNELSDRYLFYISDGETDAKDFIEKQCQEFYGIYQSINSNGEFVLKRYTRTITESTPVMTLDNSDITSMSDLSQSSRDIINLYDIRYNYNHIDKKTNRRLVFIDSSSITSNGNLTNPEKYTFKTISTARHTDSDIRNFYYQRRELSSNAPYHFSVRGNKKHLGVEVGDTIGISTDKKRDYVAGTSSFARTGLVSKKSIDFKTGAPTFTCVASGLAPTAVTDPGIVGSSGELLDAWLIGEGTDLESLPEVTAGVVTTDLTLTGTANMNDTASIFYIDGDFIVPNTVTLTLDGNVQIRATGEIAIQNGSTVTGNGNGITGGTVAVPATDAGFYGSSRSGFATDFRIWGHDPFDEAVEIGVTSTNLLTGQVATIPVFNLVNRDGELSGVPNDLRGCPGQHGPSHPDTPVVRSLAGGAGGNSGAGLVTISRGLSIGATASISLNGLAGSAGQTGNFATGSTPDPIELRGGTGGNGAPGNWLCIIDGDFTPPTFENFDASQAAFARSSSCVRLQYVPPLIAVEDDGQTSIRTLSTPTGLTLENGTAIAHEGGTISDHILATWTALNDSDVEYYQLRAKRTADPDYIIAAIVPEDEAEAGALIPADYGVSYSVQIRATGIGVKPSAWSTAVTFTVTSEVANPSDVTGFIVSQNGELVNFFWNLISDSNRDGYVLRFGPVGVTWENATPLLNEGKGTKVTTAYVQNGNFDFLIKAINLQRKYSTNAARYNFTVLGLLDIISETDHEPDWEGTLDGFVLHYTGKLFPEDQNLANTYGDELWDELVPTPVATSSYETPEQDSGVDSVIRIWGIIDSELGLGHTGIADPQLEVDHRGDGGSYDGYEAWSVAEVTARYAKFKIVNDNTQGVVVIKAFRSVLDSRERTEKDTNVTIAPGGTAIVFDEEFRLIPYITVSPIGSGGLIAESTSDATTGFTFHIYNASGSSVGGTGKWSATGV